MILQREINILDHSPSKVFQFSDASRKTRQLIAIQIKPNLAIKREINIIEHSPLKLFQLSDASRKTRQLIVAQIKPNLAIKKRNQHY